MVAKKSRAAVVLDTNVFIRAFKSKSAKSPNKRVLRCWLIEKLLLPVVCDEVIVEYVETFRGVLGLKERTIRAWRTRFADRTRVRVVKLGRRFTESRDPDDNVMLATAFVGKATYLVTNDRDLLDLPPAFLKKLPFKIVEPSILLRELGIEDQS